MTYTTNKNYFSCPNLENSYWAGFLAADGCLWKRGDAVELGLQERDLYHLESFASAVNYDGPICKRKSPGSFHTTQSAYRVIFYGTQQWHKDLSNNFNITPQKSLTLLPPNGLEDALSLAYIIGYIDGDGCFSYCKRDKLLIFTIDGTKEVLEWIKDKFDTLFPSNYTSVVRPSPKGHHYMYRFSGGRAESMKAYLSDIDVPKMSRKWHKEVFNDKN